MKIYTKKLFPYLLVISLFITACTSHTDREKQDFTSDWKFHLGEVAKAEQPDFDDSAWRELNLPHDWSIEGDFSANNPATPGGGALPGGIGWYRKEFQVDKSLDKQQIYIDFDGVYWNSKVWVNGVLLGERPNGYISFRYDMTPYIKFGKKNVIAVRVDNSKQPNSRWYSGSGIYRNVWLTITGKIHVDQWGTYITTPNVTEENAAIDIRTSIRNNTQKIQTVEVTSILVDAEGKKISATEQEISIDPDNVNELFQQISISKPQLWSVENPYLYKIITKVKNKKKLLDSYETPIGIRYFNFDADKGFSLNGEPTKILGVCMHHDLGCLGSAINTRALERQLEILKEMGCNGIRTSHNPPAPELLDLCDRMGFIVQDESFDMWRKRKTTYDYSQYFPDWYEKDLSDQIIRDRNHPSIFSWSIGNEVYEQWSDMNADTLSLQQANVMLNFSSDLTQKEEYKEMHVNSLLTIQLVDIVKKFDPTRPVSTGNNETEPHSLLFQAGVLDIIGFNYHIQNWENFHEKFPGQKLMITEATSGLMSRGYYEMPSDSVFIRPDNWDKQFDLPVRQCSSYDNCRVPWGNTHEESWKMVKKLDYISGMYIWTGFDYLGEPTPFWWPARSSYFGIVDLAGFPKDVYYMYQSEWTDKDVLHVFPHWNWNEGDTIDVWAYYNNADEVELFLNDKSLGKKSKNEDVLHTWWRIPYEKGTIKAISTKNGREVMQKEIHTTAEAFSIRLTADRNTIKADGKDLSFITVEVVDTNGLPVPVADNLIEFSVCENGIIAGTDNGDPTEHVSLKYPARKLFNGKALVVVQSAGKKGDITLTAKSAGMQDTQIKIKTN